MVTLDEVRWGGLETVLDARSLQRACLRKVGTRSSFPIVDFEPDVAGTFYDQFPYDFSTLSEWTSAPMLEEAIARQPQGQRRIDVGCGGGRNVPCLLRGTENVVVFDLSLQSLSRVASQFPVRPARGSVLRLPFVDGSFDFLVCDGVAHCTPDPACAIGELARVTRPGGWIYAALYRSGSVYSLLYTYVGGVLRAARRLESRGFPKVVDTVAFAGYRAASRLIKPGRVRDTAALRTIYEDYFQTPIASFHSQAWLAATFEACGASIEGLERHGNVWRVLALKKTA